MFKCRIDGGAYPGSTATGARRNEMPRAKKFGGGSFRWDDFAEPPGRDLRAINGSTGPPASAAI